MKRLLGYLFLLLVAEIVASIAVWHGTPTDWQGDPLHFWSFEVLRLQYWSLFGLSFTGIWIAERMSSRRRFLARVLAILGAVCVLGTEVVTSIFFWKRLSLNETEYLAWPDLRRYISEHLIVWMVVMLLGVGLWNLYHRRRRQHPSVSTSEVQHNG